MSSPAFVTLREQARALEGRVNLVSRSDYDETIRALAGQTFRLKPSSSVLKGYTRAKSRRRVAIR